MQGLSKEGQQPLYTHSDYCKKAIATGKQRRGVRNAAYAPSCVYYANPNEHKTSMENITMENGEPRKGGIHKATFFLKIITSSNALLTEKS